MTGVGGTDEKELTVGVLYISTGRYRVFWSKFYKTFKENFFPQSKRKIYIFSDSRLEYFLESVSGEDADNIVYTHIENKPWPFVTLLRYRLFVEHAELWKDCDYTFFINGDYAFYQRIGSEILPTEKDSWLVVAEHQKSLDLKPDEYPYERNCSSTAYIPFGKGSHYFAGGFNGGRTAEFLQLCQEIDDATTRDLKNDIIAVWHDESQLNARLVDKTVKVLSPWYVWPSYWNKRSNRKMVIAGPLDKNMFGGHAWLRGATDKKLKSKFMRRLPRYIAIAVAAAVLFSCLYIIFFSESRL